MRRSLRTVSALKALGYPGGSCLSRCKCDELPCPLLTWLAGQLRLSCPELQDSGGNRDILLVRELRELLSDLQSPLNLLTSELLENSILNKVTEFLVSELQAARIISHKELQPKDESKEEESEKEQRVEEHGSEINPEFEDNDISSNSQRTMEMEAELVLLFHSVNMDPTSQFTDVLHEVEARIARLPGEDVANPLLQTSLSSEQWMQLLKINEVLAKDYSCRRQMMIKRFQVTLESFAWGEKHKERSEALASVPPLASIAGHSRVSPFLLLVAREDLSCIEPIKAGQTTDIYKILMGNVPDRGGRPGEIEPPMPSWSERRSGNRSGRGDGRQRSRKFSDRKKKGEKF